MAGTRRHKAGHDGMDGKPETIKLKKRARQGDRRRARYEVTGPAMGRGGEAMPPGRAVFPVLDDPRNWQNYLRSPAGRRGQDERPTVRWRCHRSSRPVSTIVNHATPRFFDGKQHFWYRSSPRPRRLFLQRTGSLPATPPDRPANRSTRKGQARERMARGAAALRSPSAFSLNVIGSRLAVTSPARAPGPPSS
jgi:hypothetical protein